MTADAGWSREVYEASHSSRCWWATAYDAGWDDSGVSTDDELREIVAMERALGPVPEWAEQIVAISVRHVPPCGHYLFPRAFLDVVGAIGSQGPSALLHSYCFAVDRDRKQALMDYCLCLDAWVAGAQPEAAAQELTALSHRRIEWEQVCADLWRVLGQHTELKDLLVERTLHQTRWWIKSSPWPDDLAAKFGRDQYLGDYSETGCLAAASGNPDLRAPTFAQHASPRVQRMEARLADACPDWRFFRTVIVEFSWPCAPKAFRYLEKLLWCIGKERQAISLPSFPLPNPDEVPGFLCWEDTCPNQDEAAAWWHTFLEALRGWWQGQPLCGGVADDVNGCLGEPSPVKRWLVRLFVRRLEVLAQGREMLGLLVRPSRGAKRGARPVT
ncbi:MAG: hypothetical protein JSV65_16380 [Armatimonadota bacterium]|nr:MAG: hypothetical protein JSV65_16380 [Armatimonadota bacterium]